MLLSLLVTLQVMVPYNYKEFIDDLTYLVKNNYIPMERIDDAVSRILLVKFTMGLFEYPFGDPSLANELGSEVSRTCISCTDVYNSNFFPRLFSFTPSFTLLLRFAQWLK